MTAQFHESDWRRFAADIHLNTKRVSGTSRIEYEYSATRTARLAWEERSYLAARGGDFKAGYNAAIQHASEIAYQLHGEAAARAIQNLRR